MRDQRDKVDDIDAQNSFLTFPRYVILFSVVIPDRKEKNNEDLDSQDSGWP